MATEAVTRDDEPERAVNEEAATTTAVKQDDAENNNKKEQTQMVSVGQLFTFARTRKTRLFIAAAFCCAIVSGAVFPGTFMLELLIPS
jgi:hypothetical protein